MKATKRQCVDRCRKSAIGNDVPPIWAVSCVASWCGSRRNASSRPSSWITSSVEGWIVSPRKSRRKSACFSRTRTSTPARASKNPSIIPAGPPPTTQQRTRAISPAGMACLTIDLVVCFRSWFQIWPVRREGAGAEACDAGEDRVGRFGPAERLGLGVVPLDVGQHRRLQLLDRTVHAALEPAGGQQGEEALDLVQPRTGG